MIKTAKFAVLTAAILLVAGSSVAQDRSLARVAGQVAAVPSAALPITNPPNEPPASEPAEMSGMLVALNRARARQKAEDLVWSNAGARQAAVAADAMVDGECTRRSALKAAAEHDVAVYWTAPIRSYDGAARAQTIIPAFVVSEWRSWEGDRSSGSGACRGIGDCDSYARVLLPAARTVGCAVSICPSQAQVWACRFGE